VALKVTPVVPSGKNAGPLLESVGEASQMSVAEEPAKNAVIAGSLAAVPPDCLHSTVIGAGHVIEGAVVSTTRTLAWH
jgi:hypothetical protein